MKKILTVFTVSIYAIQICLIAGLIFFLSHNDVLAKPSMCLLVLSCIAVVSAIVTGIINIITAVKKCRKESFDFKLIIKFKFIQIPFFIINYVLWLLFALAMLNPVMIGLLQVIPIGIAFTYIVMLTTSLPLIFYFNELRKKNIVSASHMIVHTIFQLIFVVDIIDCIYLLVKNKNN